MKMNDRNNVKYFSCTQVKDNLFLQVKQLNLITKVLKVPEVGVVDGVVAVDVAIVAEINIGEVIQLQKQHLNQYIDL